LAPGATGLSFGSWAFLEQVLQFADGRGLGRRSGGGGASRGGREILAEVRTLLVDHPVRLGLAAFVVVSAVIEIAIAAGVQRAIASGTGVANHDALTRFDLAAAEKAVHLLLSPGRTARRGATASAKNRTGDPGFFAWNTLGSIASRGGASEADGRGD